MIAYLDGILAEKAPSSAVMDVHGVGYEVAIPLSTFDRLPAVGEGRMNDFGCTASFSMRVLSPKIEPLLRSLLGSMASTASLPPRLSTCMPNTSIDVDLPAPGTPVMPMRLLAPV